jgi:hypothetical protein
MGIETFLQPDEVSMGMNTTVFFVVVFAFVAVVAGLAFRFRGREFDHKATLAAIEKGLEPPVPHSAPWTPRTYLLHGMIWLFVGIASTLALTAIALTSHKIEPWQARLAAVNDARQHGATPEELRILLNAAREEEGLPIGLGFLGFIPIGVGLAYLIFYRVESKKLIS